MNPINSKTIKISLEYLVKLVKRVSAFR